jgi:hypothetical protein
MLIFRVINYNSSSDFNESIILTNEVFMNLIAITIATVSNFLLGGLWYSLLFGKLWQQESGTTFEQIKSNASTPYIYAFIFSLLAAVGFNYLVIEPVSLVHNLTLGLIIGALFVATSLGINYQFAGRSTKLFLIDAGFHITRFIIYALVFWFIR